MNYKFRPRLKKTHYIKKIIEKITREEVNEATKRYLEKGGKIKNLTPQKFRSFMKFGDLRDEFEYLYY